MCQHSVSNRVISGFVFDFIDGLGVSFGHTGSSRTKLDTHAFQWCPRLFVFNKNSFRPLLSFRGMRTVSKRPSFCHVSLFFPLTQRLNQSSEDKRNITSLSQSLSNVLPAYIERPVKWPAFSSGSISENLKSSQPRFAGIVRMKRSFTGKWEIHWPRGMVSTSSDALNASQLSPFS